MQTERDEHKARATYWDVHYHGGAHVDGRVYKGKKELALEAENEVLRENQDTGLQCGNGRRARGCSKAFQSAPSGAGAPRARRATARSNRRPPARETAPAASMPPQKLSAELAAVTEQLHQAQMKARDCWSGGRGPRQPRSRATK